MTAENGDKGTRVRVPLPPPRVVEPPPAATEPEIMITPNVARMADEAIAALAADGSIFQRAGSLVHVVRTVEPPKVASADRVRRPVGVPVIRILSPATLTERLSTSARWLKYNGKRKRWEHALPSEPAVRAVHARGEWGGPRSLTGVIAAPTFRANGSILQRPGYDADTGLLYWPNAAYPIVPDKPTQHEAREAYAALCETVKYFPWASPAHQAAWVASVITLIARHAIDGPVPLFILDANTQGSGKSKLADATFLIALGHDAARTALPEDEDEFRKRITSLAIEGDPAVLIDNIKRPLSSASLEAAITSTRWKDRVLGMTGMVTVPMRIVWFASGNNLDVSSDIGRRSLHLRLESPLENPEERTGLPDLEQWVLARRHHLVVWALTILRAWHVAGRPAASKPWGSFEAWAAIIPAAVSWAAGVDPMGAKMSTEAGASGEKFSLAALLACVEALQGGDHGNITTRALITSLYGGGERRDGEHAPDAHPSFGAAREALEEVCATKGGQTPDTQRVAKFLRRSVGRVVGGKRIALGPVSHNAQTWRVITA